jgi:hypothetical protein
MYGDEKVTVAKFDERLITDSKEKDFNKYDLQQLEKNYHDAQSKLQKLEAELEHIKAVKEQNKAFVPPPIDPNESLTRKIYIDTLGLLWYDNQSVRQKFHSPAQTPATILYN